MKKCMLLTVLFLAISAGAQSSADAYPVKIERGVAVAMRDNVVLRADIYRPNAEGRFPVLLERTPYDKSAGLEFGLAAAARGYVVVVQDVRGRYTSESDWYPFKNESQDGYDTVEWAAALPYSNGKVGMFDGSYVGATQLLAAIRFDRNSNTAQDDRLSPKPIKATNAILHDKQHPSALILPVVGQR